MRRIPLTFEKGVLESVESSMVPLGFATKLENWEPGPDGNLVSRTGWVTTSTSGAPATRRSRGIGRYQSISSYQTPSVVQQAKGTTSGTSISVSWPAATTAGNLLVAIAASDSTSAFTMAGWTTAVSTGGVGIFYKADAASASGSVTATIGASSALALVIMEWNGVVATSPLDRTASNSGTSTTPDSGTTAATTEANEVWIAALRDNRSEVQSSPTNGFSQVTEQQSGLGVLTLGVYKKTVTATGTANVSVTTATSDAWRGAVATFKAAVSVASSASTGFYLVAHQDTTGHGIYVINGGQLSSGTWSLIETVANSGPSWPVSFATGLQVVLYTSPYFSTLRQYNGTAASAVAGSPAGRVVVFHKNRFFVGGTTAHPSRLWYSELGDHTAWWKAAKGETSLSDSTNYIDIDKDDGDAIEDVVPFEDGLLIAKEGSVHFLAGTGPDTFVRQRFNTGTATAGRCICATPYGAVIAAKNQVGLWAGGGVEIISKPVETSYAITGDFVSTAYLDGVVRICDEGTGTLYCINMLNGAWWTEKIDTAIEAPAVVYGHDNKLLMGPQAATSGSLLSYRQIAGSRQRDHGTLPETFRAWTGDIWPEGPGVSLTPMHLHLRIRQRGTGSATTTVTPYYNNVAGSARTITAEAVAGVYHKKVVVADDSQGKGVRSFGARIEHTATSANSNLLEIEEAILEYDVDRDE